MNEIASPAPHPMGHGNRVILDVLIERHRQTRVEGYTPEHDDSQRRGELAEAAICYLVTASSNAKARAEGRFVPPVFHVPVPPLSMWPWDADRWQPETARRNLVRAAAFVVAEIERLDRAEGTPVETGSHGPA